MYLLNLYYQHIVQIWWWVKSRGRETLDWLLYSHVCRDSCMLQLMLSSSSNNSSCNMRVCVYVWQNNMADTQQQKHAGIKLCRLIWQETPFVLFALLLFLLLFRWAARGLLGHKVRTRRRHVYCSPLPALLPFPCAILFRLLEVATALQLKCEQKAMDKTLTA